MSKQPTLTVTQMLWVNLIMDTFAALALASLPPNQIVMTDRPRRATDNIITRSMAMFIGGCGIAFSAVMIGAFYFLLHHHTGNGCNLANASIDPQEISIYFTTFVFLQFWNLFNAKSFGSGHSAFHNFKESKLFFGTIVVIFVGQILIVEYGGSMFACVPMTLKQWAIIIAATSPVMLLGELHHLLIRKSTTLD